MLAVLVDNADVPKNTCLQAWVLEALPGSTWKTDLLGLGVQGADQRSVGMLPGCSVLGVVKNDAMPIVFVIGQTGDILASTTNRASGR